MSATTLYVKACRCLYSNDGKISWSELFDLLPQIRNALSCRVCRGLVVDPQSTKYCQHYVCKNCLKRKKALNPGCKWCLDWSQLRENDRYIRIILACYKLLCKTIKSSHFYTNNVQDAKIAELLEEGISTAYDFEDFNSIPQMEGLVFSENSITGKPVSRDTPSTHQHHRKIEKKEQVKDEVTEEQKVYYTSDVNSLTSLSDDNVIMADEKSTTDKDEENQGNKMSENNSDDKMNNHENIEKLVKSKSCPKSRKAPIEPMNYCRKLRFERKRGYHQISTRRRKQID